jgi:hypothetical protein
LRTIFVLVMVMMIAATSCKKTGPTSGIRILFLHHSTGQIIWNGGKSGLIFRITGKINTILGRKNKKALIPSLFFEHNKQFGTNYDIEDLIFPKANPYGWHNYPFDYYNIWVKNAGTDPFLEEPTLEILTKEYQVIIFKHCFPVSNIQTDKDSSDINSAYRSLANYKLQYIALRDKLHQFPSTKFIIWTGAALVKSQTNDEKAKRAREFFNWVINEWDLPNDNIYLWDFYSLQTEGQLYFQEKFSQSETNSHPNAVFSDFAARLLFNRIIDVIESGGSNTELTGSIRKK